MSKLESVNINLEWKNGKLPLVNGIIYSNGEIDWINVDFDSRSRKIELGSRLHIDDLLQSKELKLTKISILNKTEDLSNKINAYCGEGGFGGDGFVVIESKTDSQIKWVAFFENSNPFDKIEVVDDIIYAYNNLKERWTFRLDRPTELCIELIS